LIDYFAMHSGCTWFCLQSGFQCSWVRV